jgi:ribosomal protein S18 acetylase RimI-like enzyme
MVAEFAISPSTRGHLRRLDMRRDLAKVADLVELCFSDTLDPEGRQYLNEMRRAAQAATFIGLASNLISDTTMPPSGYVWEEDDRLVGNLSLIPIVVERKRAYMIANVATHPDYRHQGIATQLTMAALKHAQINGAPTVWLQVREDNASAIHIYLSNGFVERLRRTSWYNGPSFTHHTLSAGVAVKNRQASHWTFQRKWLKRIYPRELSWNIPFDWNLFRPDLWGKIYRTFNLDFIQHWSVEHYGELKGVLSWKHARGFTDNLWLAIPEQFDADTTLALLLKARGEVRRDQPLSLNLPANLADDVLRRAGFYPHQTLIWMEHPIVQ